MLLVAIEKTTAHFNPASGSITSTSWVCNISEEDTGETSNIRGLTPFVVFAMPRVGSNLFFDFLQQMHYNSPQEDLTLLSLFEAFKLPDGNQMSGTVKEVGKHLAKTCYGDVGFDPTCLKLSKHEASVEIEKSPLLHELVVKDDYRRENPYEYLDFLNRVPATSSQGYYAFKVFRDHIPAMGHSVQSFADMIRNCQSHTKFAVIWRRRMIESFVSFKIAMAKSVWLTDETTRSDAIYVDRRELEREISQQQQYYRSVHSVLDKLVGPGGYEVFEYDRDLSNKYDHLSSLQRIKGFLNLPNTTMVNEEILKMTALKQKKQARVPLEAQILNWDEVCEWGYCGGVDEWEDLFPGK